MVEHGRLHRRPGGEAGHDARGRGLPDADGVARRRGARPETLGKLVTQRKLLQEVWGPLYEKETNYLRVYMAQIRSSSSPIRPGPATSSRRRGWATV